MLAANPAYSAYIRIHQIAHCDSITAFQGSVSASSCFFDFGVVGACLAGKEGSMSSLKSRMAALKKGMGIGTSDVKGSKLPHAAAATDATSIQLRLALIILVSKHAPCLPGCDFNCPQPLSSCEGMLQ